MLSIPEESNTTSRDDRKRENERELGEEIELNQISPLLPPPVEETEDGVRRRSNVQPEEVNSETVPSCHFGATSQVLTCPLCQDQVNTEIKYKVIYERNWKSIFTLIILFPFIITPFCRCHPMKAAHHYCPKCKILLGRHKKPSN